MEKPKKKGDIYFWIKLQDDFFSQEDIRYLRTLPSGSDIVIIYLELLCISLRQEGYVYLRGRYPTVEEEIAFLLSEDAQLVRLALAALENCKLITRGEQLDVYMEEFDCMVGSETAHARRKRDYRIRQQTLLALEEKHGTLSQASASITANTATTPESVVLSALTFSCRPMHRKNTQTVRPYGTQLKKPSVVRTPSLHTVLKFPCRMNFLLKKTSLWQGNFCFGSLSAGA